MVVSLVIVSLFFAVHLWSRRLEHADRRVKGMIFSFAGGVSAAYVFVHLVPELRTRERQVTEALTALPDQSAIYYLALVGFVLFFGMERLVARAEAAANDDPAAPRVALPIAWTHLGVFALYSFVIGHLLVEEHDRHPVEFFLYGLALSLHFMVNDHALRVRHAHLHTRHGRLVLAVAVLAGWCVGVVRTLPEPVIAILFALLAGGIVLNVVKEELPPDGGGSFTAFFGGAACYAALLVLVDALA